MFRLSYRASCRILAGCILLFIFLINKNLSHRVLFRHPPADLTLVEPIPQKIWQIYFPPEGGDHHDQLRYVDEWKKNSKDFTYTLVGDELGDAFVSEHFDAEVAKTYKLLRNPAMKSDFLRYLLLSAEGGYYSDLDTRPVKPLDEWLPLEYKSRIRLMIAPEHDDGINSLGKWPHPVQFCQWTIVAAPGHLALKQMVRRALEGLQDLAAVQGVEINDLRPSSAQVWNATGPPAWTEVIFENIKKAAPEIQTYHDLSRFAEPRVFGDILLLPMDAFMTLSAEMRVLEGAGSHQLVHHDFAGAWKTS
ncbi:alpha-mannosyltransferase och1 [Colletotrichum truncatum]|uniref:Alpha-mannosyltransferase och1 n=1 Tax=Colletotrichum truncatum TaxID=5467 RepID=A0ACC3Z1W0_COLTU|nr:alpha-mannosyltransferase och1 [Colletotrichum truncatum]KAF6781384.1 alpha-mannosyltransferase och1 [Colletotrichum truncatum]